MAIAGLLAVTHLTVLLGFAVSAADRGEPVKLDAATVALLVREGCARALFLVMQPLGMGQAPPRSVQPPLGPDGPPRPRAPVVLVPGHGHNRVSLAFLRAFLVNRGWEWVWPVNVASREAGLADMAMELGRRVDELRRITGADKVDVVGQSMGGLVAAWYVHHLDGDAKVRRLVTLGTPWGGTRVAVFARSKLARDLMPGSPVLDGLAPPPVPTVCVWSPHDPVVVPAESATPDGTDVVALDGCGHTEMMVSSRAFRAVQAALSHLPSTAGTLIPDEAPNPS